MADPLKLADGTLVYPDGRIVQSGDTGSTAVSREVSIVAVPTNREAQRLVVETRKKLADLPDVPKTMNAVSIVLSYSLFGLDADEIALATNLPVERIEKIKSTDAYTSMHDEVVRSIVAAESNDVRDLFIKQSRTAAATMFDALAAGKASDRIMAAKDILDRSGFRPNDVVEHRHRLDGGLTIEIVRKDEVVLPTIDMTMED